MWCIGELGLPYRRYDVGHRYGGTDTAEFLALNPNGTVPVLSDEDSEPLWETGAILRYLISGALQYRPVLARRSACTGDRRQMGRLVEDQHHFGIHGSDLLASRPNRPCRPGCSGNRPRG
jgi:glutathione S-transferase